MLNEDEQKTFSSYYCLGKEYRQSMMYIAKSGEKSGYFHSLDWLLFLFHFYSVLNKVNVQYSINKLTMLTWICGKLVDI